MVSEPEPEADAGVACTCAAIETWSLPTEVSEEREVKILVDVAGCEAEP